MSWKPRPSINIPTNIILQHFKSFTWSLSFNISKGEIFSCGATYCGQLGLGHFALQTAPTTNLPSNIVQFICGFHHSLFLDSDGNVFSVGDNFYGQLGRFNDRNIKLKNLLPIRTDVGDLMLLRKILKIQFLLWDNK